MFGKQLGFGTFRNEIGPTVHDKSWSTGNLSIGTVGKLEKTEGVNDFLLREKGVIMPPPDAFSPQVFALRCVSPVRSKLGTRLGNSLLRSVGEKWRKRSKFAV